jgi:hypothetical protein
MSENNQGVSGFDLACIVKQTMQAHTARKGCSWVPGAYESIINLPSFKALAADLEQFEICNAA